MRHTSTHHGGRAAIVILVLLLACLGLAACGGSGSSSTTTVAANATPTATGAGGTTSPVGPTSGPGAGRFAAMRACLQKEGIALPQRTPGQRRAPGTGGFLGGPGGGPGLPKGVTRAQFEAALRKCGGGRPFSGRPRIENPAFRKTLTAYAACLRQNGINVPTPNTSGTGPVFNTKGIDTASAQFRAAQMKCLGILRSGFARPRGGASSAGGAGGGGA